MKEATMKVYKVTFVKNAIVSCIATDKPLITGTHAVQHYKGQLIYALIMAETEEQAILTAKDIINKDFISMN
jgi:hypothetical protein